MAPLKKNLAVLDKYEAFYTGGRIQISSDGLHMFCGFGQKVRVIQVANGKLQCEFGKEDEEMTSFCISPDDEFLVLATQNLLLRKWTWKNKELVHSWKAIHTTPVMCMNFDPTSTLLATGGSDFLIKIWDSIQQYCTHHLRGHTGVVRLLQFHPDIKRLQLVSAADDDTVRVWDLKTSTCLTVSQSHFSLVRDVCFTNNGDRMYSCGGDKVICVWDMTQLKVVKTFPIFESLESVMVLENLPVVGEEANNYLVTACSNGALKVVNVNTASCVHSDNQLCEEKDGEPIITQAFYCQALDKIVVVTYEHNIMFFNPDFSLFKQLSGHLEEVLDIGFVGKNGSHLVVATNSNKVKLFNRTTMECCILPGHTGTVMCVSTSRSNLFATASRDSKVRVWMMNPDTFQVRCLALGEGHTKAINAVAFSRSGKFLVTGSEDQTIKVWTVPSQLQKTTELVSLTASITEWAHEDDINSLDIAPNEQYLASASKDKTVKVWSLPKLKLQGVVRGHKRGVWCVRFSTVDKCFVSSSADGKICVWNMTDFSALKTFEGHNSSVVKVAYISNGQQLLSSDTEGLLKLWTLQTGICEKTFDAHENKLWALAVHPSEDVIISGGTDSTIITWKDTTDEEVQKVRDTLEKQILQEQKLENYIKEKKFLKAIGLAISLEQPYRVLTLLKNLLKEPTGFDDLRSTLCKLKPHQIGSLLRYSSQWNTNSRHCQCSQTVLNIILKSFTVDELLAVPDFKSSLEGLFPYTERHFTRADKLQQEAEFPEFTWQCM